MSYEAILLHKSGPDKGKCQLFSFKNIKAYDRFLDEHGDIAPTLYLATDRIFRMIPDEIKLSFKFEFHRSVTGGGYGLGPSRD